MDAKVYTTELETQYSLKVWMPKCIQQSQRHNKYEHEMCGQKVMNVNGTIANRKLCLIDVRYLDRKHG